jgi:hypothetical protein
MIAPTISIPVRSPVVEELCCRFEAALPMIKRVARFHFRHIVCPDRKADQVAETIAVAWNWFVHLAERGKDASLFVSALTSLAARRVQCGRRLCGMDTATDVLSRVAQRRHGFAVNRLSDLSTVANSPMEEALVENTVTPPNEQAVFRIDFPRWRSTYSDRDRQIMDDLMIGERSKDVSKKYGISPGRVSQKRRDFHQDWRRFHGEGEDEKRPRQDPLGSD